MSLLADLLEDVLWIGSKAFLGTRRAGLLAYVIELAPLGDMPRELLEVGVTDLAKVSETFLEDPGVQRLLHLIDV